MAAPNGAACNCRHSRHTLKSTISPSLCLSLSRSLSLPDNVSIFLNYSKTQIICCYMAERERDRPAAAAGPIGARFLDRAIVQITPSLTPINFGQAAGSSVRVVALTHTATRRAGPSRTGRSRFQSPIAAFFPLLSSSAFLAGCQRLRRWLRPRRLATVRDRAPPNAAKASHY